MRRIYSLVLLIALVCPMLIGYILYENQVYKIRKKIKRKFLSEIHISQLSRISIHRNDIHELKWEHSKEFQYKGKLYDIVQKHIKKDSIIYYAWLDNEELLINKKFEDFAKKQFSSETDDINLIKIKSLTYIKDDSEHNPVEQYAQRQSYFEYSNHYQFIIHKFIFHPPIA